MKKILIHTRLFTALILFSILIFLFSTSIYFKRSDLKVVFLNVGQGDSIFIEFSDKTQILVDSGKNDAVLRELAKVMPFWDRSIDYIVETHPDSDHIGGFLGILDRYEIGGVIKTDVLSETSLYKNLEEKIEKNGIENIEASVGLKIKNDKDIFEILFPDISVKDFETNTASVVAKVFSQDKIYLLTGDSPQSIEKYLVYRFGDYLKSDVLKLGHHGSKTSSSENFLEAVNPQVAIISAGKDNAYGHPHKEVLDLLDDLGIKYSYTFDK